MLFKSWTHQNFTVPHYNIAENIIIFQNGLQFCQHSFSTFQQNKNLHQAEVSLLPLQPVAQGILHCLIIQGMVPSQAVFQKTKQEKIDGVRLKNVRWVWW